jgi:sugar/nucleoside kinase (ribokinase family)
LRLKKPPKPIGLQNISNQIMQRHGILAAGNWIVDHVKIIDTWPQQDALANILSQSSGNGGSPYNVLKDLVKLGAAFPLQGAGLIGDDSNGKLILADCNANGIDTSRIKVKAGGMSSYTDVMTVQNTGRRTFFHARGTNDDFAPEDLNLDNSNAKIFHLGYMLLLKKMDAIDAYGRTAASYMFEKAKKLGYKTSADIVSESSDRFYKVISPSLPYLDYLFMNEYEAGKLTGIPLGDSSNVDEKSAERALKAIIDAGINEWVFLHYTKGCMAMHRSGQLVKQPALKIPKEKIKGATGAGDAFAAGALLGLHNGEDITKVLLYAVCSAASSLFEPECSEGVLPLHDALSLAEQFGFY